MGKKVAYDKEYYEGAEGSNYHGYEDGEHFGQRANQMIERFMLKPGAKVLEVGCAKGYMVDALVRSGIDAFGVDVSRYAISKGSDPTRLSVGSLEHLPFGDKSFDLVCSFDTLEHLHEEDVPRAVQELMRVSESQYHIITTPEYTVGEDDTHYCMKPIAWWREQFPVSGKIVIKHSGEI